jgi:hypothetical protein
MRRRWAALALTLGIGASLLVPGCGGGGSSPSGPSAPVGPPTPSGLVLVSGETGQPIGGARVTIAGQSLTADAQGAVAVPTGTAVGALLDLVAPGFLDRQTVVRSSSGATRLALWPRTSATGLNEHFTATLVYTTTSDGAPIGGQSMRRHRPGSSVVHVVLSASLLADPDSVFWHQLAADSISAATGGRVVYRLSTERPIGATVIDVSYDPANTGCSDLVRGFSTTRTSGGEIQSGSIVYCVQDATRTSTVVHELGHSFGLYHSPDPGDVMYFQFVRGRAEVYTPKEALAMRLMMDRASGTRFPDNDRETTGLTAVTDDDGAHTIRCRG